MRKHKHLLHQWHNTHYLQINYFNVDVILLFPPYEKG